MRAAPANYEEWAARWPDAAREFDAMLAAVPWPDAGAPADRGESWAQQRVRMQVVEQGGFAWRNNVGATPSKCKHCGEPQQPVRYGLANDSARLNKAIKSSDLILALPRVIRPHDVGRTIAQFGSIEVKEPGWQYSGKGREEAQAKWLSLVQRIGGWAKFSTGEVNTRDW